MISPRTSTAAVLPTGRRPREVERHRLAMWPPCVLLVHRRADLRRALADALRASGCDVVEVDGVSALLDHVAPCEVFGRLCPPPDLLVCDARVEGFAAPDVVVGLAAIRALAPVVLLGVEGTADLEEATRRIGPVAVLPEPVDLAAARDGILDLVPDDAWLRSSWFW